MGFCFLLQNPCVYLEYCRRSCRSGWAATVCVSRAPSSRRVGNSLTSSPAISTSRNKAQMSTHPSRLSSAVSSAQAQHSQTSPLAAMISRLVPFCDCQCKRWRKRCFGLLSCWLGGISPGGRITEEELRARVDPQKTLCFLCGPPPMIEELSKTLLDSGLPKDKILFEKWW